MSVRRLDNNVIALEGDCPVEDAEALLQLLMTSDGPELDWTRCTHVHTAVLQVVMAARPRLTGPCAAAWVQRWIAVP